jgi:undecaprenyl-diphosphatase
MNPFDLSILSALNEFSQRSERLDKLVGLLFGNALVEGGFLTTLIWWAWFRKYETAQRDREFVASGIVLTACAVFVARLIALFCPFRLRPRYVDGLHFRLPVGSANYEMFNWSSFPSDHAALFFCLATILFFISRRAGALALLHALLVVSLTRIYLGIHYPSDILAGMLIGVGFASLALHSCIRRGLARPALRWMEVSPRSFYPCLSLCLLLVATQFDPLREMLVDVWRAARSLTHT